MGSRVVSCLWANMDQYNCLEVSGALDTSTPGKCPVLHPSFGPFLEQPLGSARTSSWPSNFMHVEAHITVTSHIP